MNFALRFGLILSICAAAFAIRSKCLSADDATAPKTPPSTTVSEKPPIEKPSIEPRYLSNIRQITSGFMKAGEGYFSPDGKSIIYQAVADPYPFYQIYSQPLVGPSLADGKPKLVSTGRGKTTCSFFAPDGSGIIYASSHLDPDLTGTETKGRQQLADDAKPGHHRKYQWDFDPNMEIFAANTDGTHVRRLTYSKGYDAEDSYSPDGKQIVFCSDRGGNPNLYIMDADGSNVRQLTHAKGYNGGPFFSPDGRRVIFRSDRKEEGNLQIHVIDVDGQNDMALTDNHGVNWAPYWHPNKPYIIWTAADHSDPHTMPNFDLWLLKYEINDNKFVPGKLWRITDNPAADVLPVFSPDGKQIMWTSNRTANHTSQLFLADFKLPEEPNPAP